MTTTPSTRALATIGALWLATACASTPSLEDHWNDQTPQARLQACALWNSDRDAAVQIITDDAKAGGDDPDKYLDLFEEQCA